MGVAAATTVAILLAAVSACVSFRMLRDRPRSWVKAVDFFWLPFALVGVYATIYQVSSLRSAASVESALAMVKESAARLPSRHCISRASPWTASPAPAVSCDDVAEFMARVERVETGEPVDLEHMRVFSWEDGDVAASVNAYNVAIRGYESTSSGVWRRVFDALQVFGPFLLAIAFGIRMSRAMIEFSDERQKEKQQARERPVDSPAGPAEASSPGNPPASA